MSNSKNNFKSLEVVVNYGNYFQKVVFNNLINSPSGLLVKTSRVSFPRGLNHAGKAHQPVVTCRASNGKTIEIGKGTTAAYLPNGLSCIFTIKATRAQWHGEVCILVDVAIGDDIEVNERLAMLAEFAEIKADIKAVFAEDSLEEKIQKAKTQLMPFNRA